MYTSLDVLCNELPKGIKTFISYARNLKFLDRPNYSYLKQLLIKCSKSNLNEYDFDWEIKVREEKFIKYVKIIYSIIV